MKSARIAIILGVVASVVVGVVLTQTGGRDDSTPTTSILDVNELATSPSTFAGREVRLRGIVSAVQPEQHLFAVIDHAEYEACKVVTCSQYQIPIAYAGELPAVETSVAVTGRLTQPESGRYLFQATAVELKP